jgi:Glycosyltransferase family 10 (fucosyltransferase) C-term
MPPRGCEPRRVIAIMFIAVVIFSVSFNIYGAGNQINLWIDVASTDFSPPTCKERKADTSYPITTTGRVTPKLLHCGGYALNRNLKPTLKSLLPEYEWVDLRRVSDWKGEAMLTSASRPWDFFVSNYQLDECNSPDFYQWLHLRFNGKVLFWTPEDAINYLELVVKPNYYPMGPGSPLPLTFLQTAFWAQIPDVEKQNYFFGTPSSPPRRPRSRGTHFLIYAHSRCVDERQTAFQTIANYNGGIFPTVYHGGRCNGGMDVSNTTKVQKFPNKIRLDNWEDNRYLYQDFRFCLAMEHANTPGYITEKILVAFWAGCLPIYWGPKEEIMGMFHSESFVFWDVADPEPALERIRYLEENRSAYDEAMSRPILAPGALERYFSFDEKYGGGALRAKIRANLGLDSYRFISANSGGRK